ncbi:hypothetical protein H1R17_03645 [Flavobacterium sp. xlx-214]|uniref:hypothetical protein n=1 Tax=unclassified Flavobacterium TaxID=196869 RepID=UPI0013D1F58B|nr:MULTISPECIES: hypothetical protein [unclassified Flavobacterium]MBA5791984.1 hypothetical protein [Flavobacterium sp. xlx-221]QMI84238.1 hypothetical protein H1R17_03645 [Flavobacterium sp. xlx-214]
MSVRKSVLETKTNTELEEYIKKGNRFVPEASLYAFEILKTRGRVFTEEEAQSILLLVDNKNKASEVIIHPNHTKAAQLMYISAALGIINMILSPDILSNFFGIFIAFLVLAIIVAMGYLVSKGYDWMKYVLLIFMIFGLITLPIMIINITQNPIITVVNIIQTILQIYALMLLFKIPNN